MRPASLCSVGDRILTSGTGPPKCTEPGAVLDASEERAQCTICHQIALRDSRPLSAGYAHDAQISRINSAQRVAPPGHAGAVAVPAALDRPLGAQLAVLDPELGSPGRSRLRFLDYHGPAVQHRGRGTGEFA